MIGGVLSVDFAEEIGIGDHGIVRREMVALVTEGADLDLGGEDDASVRVEDRGIGFAQILRSPFLNVFFLSFFFLFFTVFFFSFLLTMKIIIKKKSQNGVVLIT